jgi:hypothetical protein
LRIAHFHFFSLLIDTSGAGKTRLLLDGLCQRWGFYFVGQTETSGIGSRDLSTFISELDTAKGYQQANEARKENPENHQAFGHMQNAVTRRILQLLLARFLILNLLIEEAKKSGGVRQKEHRRLWVLLQVLPNQFSDDLQEDLFLTVARVLRHATVEDLRGRIFRLYQTLRQYIEEVAIPGTNSTRIPPFYVIIDEIQSLSRKRIGEFRSTEKTWVQRPVLREIWRTLKTILLESQLRIILSGTGIDMGQIKNTLGSQALLPEPIPVYSSLGGFVDIKSQTKYIQRYIQAPWTEKNWEEFLTRAFAWFRGR